MSDFGTLWRKTRERAGWSRQALANRMGLSSQYVLRVELGQDPNPLKDHMIRRGAELMGVDPMPLITVASQQRTSKTVSISVEDQPEETRTFLCLLASQHTISEDTARRMSAVLIGDLGDQMVA